MPSISPIHLKARGRHISDERSAWRQARRHRFTTVPLLALAVSAFAVSMAQAQTNLYWDGTPGFGGNHTINGASDGGTGFWTASTTDSNSLNWDNGTAEIAWPNTTGYIAVFGGTAGRVYMAGSTLAAGGILFQVDGYVIDSGTVNLGANGITTTANGTLGTTDGYPSGGPSTTYGVVNEMASGINLLAAQSWTVNTGDSLLVSGTVADATGFTLTKAGAGRLIMTGNNTYTGATVITGGVLAATNLSANGNASSIGQGTAVTLNGGTLRYIGGGTGNANGGSFNRTITVGANGGTLDSAGTGFLAYDGSFAGSGTITILDSTGNNQQVLYTGSSSGNYTGNIVVGSASANSGFLQYRSSNANAFGSGTITINAGGTFSADSGGSTPSTLSNPFTLNGGILGTQAPNMTYSGAITLATGTTSSVGHISNGGGNVTLSGVIGGTGNLNVGVAGQTGTTVTLNGSSTYTGTTIVSAGILATNNLQNNGTASGIGQGTAVTLNGGTLQDTGGNQTFNRTITVGANGGTLDLPGNNIFFYDGALAGSGTVTFLDSSLTNHQWLYRGNSSGFTGNIVIGNASANSGFVQYRSGNANPFGSGSITINAGGTLSADDVGTTIPNAITLNGGILGTQTPNLTYTGPITLNAASSSVGHIANGSGNVTLTGAIGGTGGLTVIGGTTVTVSGAGSYTGATTVSSGTLSLDNNNSTTPRLASTSGITVSAGGMLRLAQSGATASTDRIGNAVPVTLAASATANGGGIFNTGGLNEGPAGGASGSGAAMGALTLRNNSTIDFSTGATTAGSNLLFASLTYTSGDVVSIKNFTGTPLLDAGLATNDRLLFSTNPNLTTAQLASITFYNDLGTAFATGATEISFNGYTELVPVPEPSTWIVGLLLVGYAFRRRLLVPLAALSQLRR